MGPLTIFHLGLGRDSPYKALSTGGKTEFPTVMMALNALKFGLHGKVGA